MDPLFRVGDNVPVRIKSLRTQFEKGDIIAFNRDQKDISNFESNNFYDYLKIDLLVEDISKIFASDSDQFVKQLFQDQEFLKNVFNTEVMKVQYKKDKLPNILEELFYSIYIMNPDNSLDSTFNKNNKRKALEMIKNYLLSNGYDINNLGLDEKELFVDYYNEYMHIIDNSLKIEINGKPSKISSRSLDPIKARIWYKVQEYNFFEFINEKFDISIDPNNIENLDPNDRNKVACYLYSLRNIFRVKSRNLINDFKNTEDFMRSEACYTRKEIFDIHNGDPILVITASRRGRQKYDNLLKELILKNIEYQEWCKILGVDYQEFIRKYLTLLY